MGSIKCHNENVYHICDIFSGLTAQLHIFQRNGCIQNCSVIMSINIFLTISKYIQGSSSLQRLHGCSKRTCWSKYSSLDLEVHNRFCLNFVEFKPLVEVISTEFLEFSSHRDGICTAWCKYLKLSLVIEVPYVLLSFIYRTSSVYMRSNMYLAPRFLFGCISLNNDGSFHLNFLKRCQYPKESNCRSGNKMKFFGIFFV